MAGGTLVVRFIGDARAFNATTDAVARRLTKVGSTLATAGRTMTLGLTLPIVGVGVAATKMALDYENAFTKIAAVSNASAKDVAKWKEQVKGLAGETAKDPRELANALFFLASAGLKASQIMPTLEASAKASAAGLGNTSDIARLTANALNAYASTGLEAAQVTDILVAAVREGSADSDEFAAAMGRILPIASKAGVTFDQVAASLATLSNIGLDVDEGVTAMRSLLAALEAPGTQAANTLKEIGLSADRVRQVISEQGVLGALRLLEERTNGNIDTMRKIVPNIRAMTGAFGLTTQEASKVDDVFNRVLNSTGSLGKAFAETAESPGFKLQQALTDVKLAAIDLGEKLLPIAVKIAKAIAKVVDWFSKLPGPVKDALLVFGGLLATVGPILLGFGKLIIAIKDIRAAFLVLKAIPMVQSIGALGPAAAVAAVGIGLLVSGWIDAQNRARIFEESVRSLTQAILDGKDATEIYTRFQSAVIAQTDSEWARTQALALGKKALAEAEERAGVATGRAADAARYAGQAQAFFAGKTDDAGHALDRARAAVHRFAGMGTKALNDFRAAVSKSIDSAIGDLAGFKKGWELTSAQAVRNMQGMADKSGQMARDFKRLDKEAIPDKFKAWLMQQGPDAVHAFVTATKKGKDDMLAAWRAFEKNMREVMQQVKRITGEGGRRAGQAFGQGLAAGISSQLPAIAGAAMRAAHEAERAAREALDSQSPSKVAKHIGEDFIQGLIIGIQSKDSELAAAAKHTAEKLQHELERALSKAQDALNKVLNKASSFRSTITGGFSSLLDISSALPLTNPADIQGFFANQVATAQQFASVLQALKTQGASRTLLSKIAGAGPESIGFAQSLLQMGPAGIASVNASLKTIAELAGATGESLTQDFFGERIEALRADVRGIRDELKEVERLLSKRQVIEIDGREVASVTAKHTESELFARKRRNGVLAFERA